MTENELGKFASRLGKRGYRARLQRFGIEHIREIARENGRKCGSPRKSEGGAGHGN